MLNQDATLSLYASIDMGVHYDGWSLADTAEFLGSYGIKQVSVISEIYQSGNQQPDALICRFVKLRKVFL